MREKIDPHFLRIMDSVAQKTSSAQGKCRTDSLFLQKQKSTAKYACIVYTKNATALREKGITVNSVLPSFATAFATLDEIKKMSQMEAVTYIEFPANDKPLQ